MIQTSLQVVEYVCLIIAGYFILTPVFDLVFYRNEQRAKTDLKFKFLMSKMCVEFGALLKTNKM